MRADNPPTPSSDHLALLPLSNSHSASSSRSIRSKGGGGGNGKTGIKKEVALKVIVKKSVKGNESSVWSEMEVLRGLDHPNIVSPKYSLSKLVDV